MQNFVKIRRKSAQRKGPPKKSEKPKHPFPIIIRKLENPENLSLPSGATQGRITKILSTEHRITKIKTLRSHFQKKNFPNYPSFLRECVWLDIGPTNALYLWNLFREEAKQKTKHRRKKQ